MSAACKLSHPGRSCRAKLQEYGFKPEKVAELVSRTFNEMVFIHGDVHCDPHAANLFLRKNPVDGSMQLVILDHGLYRCQPTVVPRSSMLAFWHDGIPPFCGMLAVSCTASWLALPPHKWSA